VKRTNLIVESALALISAMTLRRNQLSEPLSNSNAYVDFLMGGFFKKKHNSVMKFAFYSCAYMDPRLVSLTYPCAWGGKTA
jgi:hypothetical protein